MSEQQYHVDMTIKGEHIPSSTIYSGPRANCFHLADTMNLRPHHPDVKYIAIPCI